MPSFSDIFRPDESDIFTDRNSLEMWINRAGRFAPCLLADDALTKGRQLVPPRIQPAGDQSIGACAIPVVLKRSSEPARSLLRPAFLLAVQWVEAEQHEDGKLPRGILAVADQLLREMNCPGSWRLRLYQPWMDGHRAGSPHSSLDFSALPMDEENGGASAGAALAVGLMGALEKRPPPKNGVFASAQRGGGTWLPIRGLSDKITDGLTRGLRQFHVAMKQVAEAERILAGLRPKDDCEVLGLFDDLGQAARRVHGAFPKDVRPFGPFVPPSIGGVPVADVPVAGLEERLEKMIAPDGPSLRLVERASGEAAVLFASLAARELPPGRLLAHYSFSRRSPDMPPPSPREWLADLAPRLHPFLDAVCPGELLERLFSPQPNPMSLHDFLSLLASRLPDPHGSLCIILDGLEDILPRSGEPADAYPLAPFVDCLLNAGRTRAAWLQFIVFAPDPQTDSRVREIVLAHPDLGRPEYINGSVPERWEGEMIGRLLERSVFPREEKVNLRRLLADLRWGFTEAAHFINLDAPADSLHGLNRVVHERLRVAFDGDTGFSGGDADAAAALAAARDALPESALTAIAGDEAWNAFKNRLGGLLACTHDAGMHSTAFRCATYHFQHFLSGGRSEPWMADVKKGHRLLAETGLREREWARTAGREASAYFQRHLPWHLVEAGNLHGATELLLDPAFLRRWLVLSPACVDEILRFLPLLHLQAPDVVFPLCGQDAGGRYCDTPRLTRVVASILLLHRHPNIDDCAACFGLCDNSLRHAGVSGAGGEWRDAVAIRQYAFLRTAVYGAQSTPVPDDWETLRKRVRENRDALSGAPAGDAFPREALFHLSEALTWRGQLSQCVDGGKREVCVDEALRARDKAKEFLHPHLSDLDLKLAWEAAKLAQDLLA